MTDRHFNACYKAIKEYLADIGFVPVDDSLKKMLKNPEVESKTLMIAEPFGIIDGPTCIRNILHTLKYDDNMQPTNFYSASMDIDRFLTVGDYGSLTDDANMFARALGDYVSLKYREYIKTDGPDHVFRNYNQIHVPGLFKTHNDGDEMLRFKEKFDELIVNLKLSNVITEVTRNKKMSPEDIKTYTNENHKDISHVASSAVNQTIQSSIHEGNRMI